MTQKGGEAGVKRATVIKLAGDTSLAGAIANGIVDSTIQRDYLRLQAVDGVRREADDKRWERTRRRLARKYSTKPTGRLRGAVLGVWALLWMKMMEAVRYFQHWNREG